jgi:acetate kinase
MKVLVINVGSTSIKYRLYEMDREETLAAGIVERVGSEKAMHKWESVERRGSAAARGGSGASEDSPRSGEPDGPPSLITQKHEAPVHAPDMKTGLDEVLARVDRTDLRAVGHRVVHGGEKLIRPTRISAEVKDAIRACAAYAPIHNPANLAGIEAAEALLPDVPHVAVFDTAFHAELPPKSYLYAIPHELYLQHGLRRYGFHGPSHQYMAACASEFLKTDPSRLKLITCHLGGGASVCAIDAGLSIDTSMGMTPLEGLVMGTRSGDVDPALALVLGRLGKSTDEIDEILNRRSGLLGLSGVAADFRDVERAAAGGNDRARAALEVFVHRVKKYVGAYAAALGGADAICFTGGIGENSGATRAAICDGLLYMGVDLDEKKNLECRVRDHGGVADVASPRAPTRVLVVATDEERMIAREVVRTIAGPTAARTRVTGRAIPVGVSVRHVHLSRAHCDALFGAGYELTHRRDVSQPGQYVCRETVDLIGPKGKLERVGIINPLRKETQVELARTDAIQLGVDAPLRESGKLAGTPGIKLRGPLGEIEIDHGVILAHRHVHMSPHDAETFGVTDGAMIKVKVDGDREGVMGDVIIRVSDKFALDLHVDTDEANGFALTNDSVATYDGIQ